MQQSTDNNIHISLFCSLSAIYRENIWNRIGLECHKLTIRQLFVCPVDTENGGAKKLLLKNWTLQNLLAGHTAKNEKN